MFHSLWTLPGGMTAQSPGGDLELAAVDAQAAVAGGGEVELLSLAVVVGGCAPVERRRLRDASPGTQRGPNDDELAQSAPWFAVGNSRSEE